MYGLSFLKKMVAVLFLLSGISASFDACGSPGSAENPPNVVFILVDDLGYKDIGCYGSSFYETPNIDQLAREGMKFSNAYAAASVCSPTRASILTGKYPARLKMTNWIPAPQEPVPFLNQLPLEEVTIAEALKVAGYKTYFSGKWHLGYGDYYPEKQGFDENFGGNWRGAVNRTYFSPYDLPNIEDGPEGEYLTDRVTKEAVNFIKETDKDKPFFLFLSFYAVHSPIQAKEQIKTKYENKLKSLPKTTGEKCLVEGDCVTRSNQDDPAYAAMVESVDQGVGKVLQELEKQQFADNTVVIFMSDNGGLATLVKNNGMPPTSNMPLRAGKGWLYEGGIREPMIVKWPGVTKPGSVSDEPVISNDFYATILDIANLPPSSYQHTDGLSLTPLLRGEKTLQREAIYWHYPHFHCFGERPSSAIRVGDYKLIERYEGDKIELYNLANDIGERDDLSLKEPLVAAELRKRLHAWLRSVDAGMPTAEGIEKAKKMIEDGTFLSYMKPRKMD